MASFIFDEAISISIEDLRRLKLFNPSIEKYRSATIKINRKNAISEIAGVVNVTVDLSNKNCCLELKFYVNGRLVHQKFTLVKSLTIPPKGFKWMAVCPITGSKCLKLYLEGMHFKSRKAIKHGVYKIQTLRFGYKRGFFTSILRDQRWVKDISKMKRPCAKPYYRGVVTKRHRKAIQAMWNMQKLK